MTSSAWGIAPEQERTPKTREIGTSITLEYRKSTWGLDRIVLDSISNHLPADSKGTHASITFKQGGKIRDLTSFERGKPVDEIVFADDGAGFSAGLLSVLYSSKGADALSIGQFGEGLKLVAAAALREGVTVEYQSRDWHATPFAIAENIEGQEIQRLGFTVVEGNEPIVGSRTTFTKPTKALVDEVLALPKKVLAFNNTYTKLTEETLLTTGYRSRILDMEDGSKSLFVKGVRIDELFSLFSYDLGIENISPDRKTVSNDIVLDNIKYLLMHTKNEQVIRRVLEAAHANPDTLCDEFMAFREKRDRFGDDISFPRLSPISEYDADMIAGFENMKKEKLGGTYLKIIDEVVSGNAWVKTFKATFGENAILASNDTNANTEAELLGFKPIKLNANIARHLRYGGVTNADKMQYDREYRWLDRSELTHAEQERLAMIPWIDTVVLGAPRNVDVQIYSGVFLKSGREIESNLGVHEKGRGKPSRIGIRRDVLKDEAKFASTYIHELGHDVTGVGDYAREFTDFFVQATARFAMEAIRTREQEGKLEKAGFFSGLVAGIADSFRSRLTYHRF